MNLKKSILVLAFSGCTVLTFGFAASANCVGLLTLSTNSALGQYFADASYCEDNADLLIDECMLEAAVSYNFNIDAALDDYDKCCCGGGQTCCDPL